MLKSAAAGDPHDRDPSAPAMIWLRYLGYFLGVAVITAALTQLEARYPGSLKLEAFPEPMSTFGTSEFSLVEILQCGILLVSGMLMSLVAYRSRSFRTLAIGAGGISLLFLIRELHYFFDRYVFDNLWQALFVIASAFLVAYLYRHHRRLSIGFARAWPSPGLTLMFAGLVVLLGFSLFVGHEPLWQAIMREHYVRIAKLAIEEFIELSAYYLWLVGNVELTVQVLAFERQRVPAKGT